MVPFGAVLILFIIFGSLTTVVLGAIYLRNKNKERMTILDKGADPLIFREEYKSTRNINLKLGILFISIAVGIVIGYLVQDFYYVPEGVAFFSSIFLFGGLGLLFSFIVDKRTESKK